MENDYDTYSSDSEYNDRKLETIIYEEIGVFKLE